MEPSPPNSHTRPKENIANDGRNGTNPFKDSGTKPGEKSQGLPNPFGNFRISKKGSKKSNGTEPQSPVEKSIFGKDDKDQSEGSNPFEEREPKAREKSQGLPNPFGNFRISVKSPRKQNEGERQNSTEKESAVLRGSKDQEQKDGTNPFGEPESQAGEKRQSLSNPFGNFRISKKSLRKQNEGERQNSTEESTVWRDSKDQDQKDVTNPFGEPEPQAGKMRQSLSNPFGNFRISKKSPRKQNDGERQNSTEESTVGRASKDLDQKDGTNPFGEPEPQAEMKRQSLSNPFGNFRISKKSLKKSDDTKLQSTPEKPTVGKDHKVQDLTERTNPFEEPEPKSGEKSQGLLNTFGNFRISKKNTKKPHEAEEQSSPEKESPAGLGHIFKGTKKGLKRQSQVEEAISPDKKDTFGQLGVRLSKIYQKKHENAEEGNSSEKKESSGASASLVNKLKTSMKAKKRIDFNEREDNKMEELGREDIMETVEEEELLSVMQINELIHSRQLQKAFRSVKLKEEKLMEESRGDSYYENMTEFTIRARDVDLLYGSLLNTARSVVMETLELEVDEPLVASLVYVLENEAVAHRNTSAPLGNSEVVLGQPRRWKQLWKEAVRDSAAKRVASVPLNVAEEAWLPKHLEDLMDRTVRDLVKVKKSLVGLYPEEYKVCALYLRSFHDALSSHIQNNVIIGTHVRESSKLSEELEKSSFLICVEHLGAFSTRLREDFMKWSENTFSLLSVQYSVVYINSLLKLRHNATQSDADQCRAAETQLNTAIEALKQHIFHLFSTDTKPHFQKLITKKWLKKSTAFSAIIKSARILCQCVTYLTPPHHKEMARRAHKYLVKEYIAQIMKRKMSLSQLNRKKAAERMKEEGNLFNMAAEEMGSEGEGLYEVIHCISEIIGAKKKEEIKPRLEELHHLYPDVSEDHILCILHVQGTGRSKKLLEHFHQLQKDHQPAGEPEDKLFSEIDCVTHVACFSI
ncbi:uncharacterized protein ACMZJ9_020469 [Mantella aurantiaca]